MLQAHVFVHETTKNDDVVIENRLFTNIKFVVEHCVFSHLMIEVSTRVIYFKCGNSIVLINSIDLVNSIVFS